MGEIGERSMVLGHVFNQYDRHGKGELAPHELQALHADIRMGGISYPQVLASMKYVCAGDTCSQTELYDILQEMDRRYFLLQDLRWEFSMLDREQRDTITVEQARWLTQAIHGKNFSRRKWAEFLRERAVPGSRVTFPEIEVLLCNVKSSLDIILDKEEDDREARERLKREQEAEEEARRRRDQKDDEKRRREKEEKMIFLESLRYTPIKQPTFVDSKNRFIPPLESQDTILSDIKFESPVPDSDSDDSSSSLEISPDPENISDTEETMAQKAKRRQRFLESLRRTPTGQPIFVDSNDPFPSLYEYEGIRSEGAIDEDESHQRVEQERRRQEEEDRHRMMNEEELRRRDQQRREEEERAREEERLRQLEEQNRLEEEKRRKEEEEKYRDVEGALEDIERQEREFEEALKRVRDEKKNTNDEKRRKELEDEEERLKRLHRDMKHKRIRYRLKVAIKDKDKFKLEYTINEFKTEKVEDKDMELEKAERLLKELLSRDNLRRAISRREIEELEKAIEVIKRNGMEVQLATELIEANKILVRLRKIQRIRSEILELKQSTVAEIRSYQNPPPVVHTVMTATFLILGNKEKETRNWKTVQALVGKTGKEGLKRRCLECDASKINMEDAKRAKVLLDRHELDEVRDVSAGAATFFVFSVAMVEECFDIAENGPPPALEPGPAGKGPGNKGGARATGKPRIDPSSMTISRSKNMVTTSTTRTTTRTRSKTPPARRK